MRKILKNIYQSLGLLNTVLVAIFATVLIVAMGWSASEQKKLAEKVVTATRVTGEIYRLDFEKESNSISFEKSIVKFMEEHPLQYVTPYTLPKEMWPDPDKPVVYIFIQSPGIEIPPANIEPPRPYIRPQTNSSLEPPEPPQKTRYSHTDSSDLL